MNTQERKVAATRALETMHAELDKLPEAQRNAVAKYIEELRERVKDPAFDAAMKIVSVENMLTRQRNR